MTELEACFKRNWVPSRDCKNLSGNVDILVNAFRNGDKSVLLPTLLHFTYLSDVYADALSSDAEGFLTAVSQLPEREKEYVVAMVAGGQLGLPQSRFRGHSRRASESARLLAE